MDREKKEEAVTLGQRPPGRLLSLHPVRPAASDSAGAAAPTAAVKEASAASGC